MVTPGHVQQNNAGASEPEPVPAALELDVSWFSIRDRPARQGRMVFAENDATWPVHTRATNPPPDSCCIGNRIFTKVLPCQVELRFYRIIVIAFINAFITQPC
jgi:hypothetical protein